MQKKVALLQDKWDGETKEDDVETGEWSAENLAKNRQKILEKEAPWVLKNMSVSDYYDQYIKPTQEAQAAQNMNFRHVKLSELNYDLEAETTEKGRVYKTPGGNLYPSITTVLSAYNKKAIYEWRQRVGEEVANKISAKASGRGTKLHNTVEQYLLNEMSDMKLQT